VAVNVRNTGEIVGSRYFRYGTDYNFFFWELPQIVK
jgi:hypothetical protein